MQLVLSSKQDMEVNGLAVKLFEGKVLNMLS